MQRRLGAALALVAGLAVLIAAGAAASSPGDSGGLAALVAQHCGGASALVTPEWCSMEPTVITLRPQDPQGRHEISLEVLVARDERTRQAGYQRIDASLAQATATLFLFPRPIYGAFHMCNVDAPLWIAWYREDGSPLDAALMLPGADAPAALCRDLYAPRKRETYRYALEIGAGLARDLGLDRAALLELSLVIEPWMLQAR